MEPEISEFSFGYAVTDAVVHDICVPVTAAPVFSSLYKEGVRGWDVAIPIAGVPLFLQFKLCHHMVRNTSREAREGWLRPPFYRIYLRTYPPHDQHQMLLDLEHTGQQVLYVAPAFHTLTDMNNAFLHPQ